MASAAMGSVSGSAIANVVTSGAFTIPLMKRVGYRPEEAGGIEAAASTGGQILPPIMGTGAFLIAEYTGLPYLEIVRAGLLPAILYMGTVFVFVHLVAVARGLKGIPASELPSFRRTMAKGWHYLLSLVVLIGALLMDFSVARVGFLSCLAVVALAGVRAAWDRVRRVEDPEHGPGRRRRQSPHEWLRGGIVRVADGFVVAGRNALPVSLACAVAGVIVGIVGLTGLGLNFSALMLSFSQGNLLLALILLLLASLVLGMGLPVTASYIVLIVLAGPALVNEFGLPVLTAHLVVFWFSQDSNVTPPCLPGRLCGCRCGRIRSHEDRSSRVEVCEGPLPDPSANGRTSGNCAWRSGTSGDRKGGHVHGRPCRIRCGAGGACAPSPCG